MDFRVAFALCVGVLVVFEGCRKTQFSGDSGNPPQPENTPPLGGPGEGDKASAPGNGDQNPVLSSAMGSVGSGASGGPVRSQGSGGSSGPSASVGGGASSGGGSPTSDVPGAASASSVIPSSVPTNPSVSSSGQGGASSGASASSGTATSHSSGGVSSRGPVVSSSGQAASVSPTKTVPPKLPDGICGAKEFRVQVEGKGGGSQYLAMLVTEPLLEGRLALTTGVVDPTPPEQMPVGSSRPCRVTLVPKSGTTPQPGYIALRWYGVFPNYPGKNSRGAQGVAGSAGDQTNCTRVGVNRIQVGPTDEGQPIWGYAAMPTVNHFLLPNSKSQVKDFKGNPITNPERTDAYPKVDFLPDVCIARLVGADGQYNGFQTVIVKGIYED